MQHLEPEVGQHLGLWATSLNRIVTILRLLKSSVAATKGADDGKLGFETPEEIPAEKVKTGTNLRDSPLRTSGQTSIGFQDEFYYNRSIKHYKGCIQVPS